MHGCHNLCSDTTLTHPHPPYRRQACQPLHRNPQPLPLTTRNPCEAKPYCLLKPPRKFFFYFSDLGFGKILAAENFGSMTAAHSLNSKSCIHSIHTISKISKHGNQYTNTFSQLTMYIHMSHYTISKYVLTK